MNMTWHMAPSRRGAACSQWNTSPQHNQRVRERRHGTVKEHGHGGNTKMNRHKLKMWKWREMTRTRPIRSQCQLSIRSQSQSIRSQCQLSIIRSQPVLISSNNWFNPNWSETREQTSEREERAETTGTSFNVYFLFDSLVWSMSHLLTWRRRSSWPVLQPDTSPFVRPRVGIIRNICLRLGSCWRHHL